MSKIDELIAQYCPNGVEYKELGEVLDYEQPNKYNGLIIELQQTGESLPLNNVINVLQMNEQIPPLNDVNDLKMNKQIPPLYDVNGLKMNGQIPPLPWSTFFCSIPQKSSKRFRNKIRSPLRPPNRNYFVGNFSINSHRSSTAKPISPLLKNWGSLPKRPKTTLSAFPHKTLSFIMRMTGTKNPKIRYIQKTTLLSCFFLSDINCQKQIFPLPFIGRNLFFYACFICQ